MTDTTSFEEIGEAPTEPTIHNHAFVLVGPDRISFEGPWSFRFPAGQEVDPSPEVQGKVSLLMIEYAIKQLISAQAKIEEKLGMPMPEDQPRVQTYTREDIDRMPAHERDAVLAAVGLALPVKH